MRFFKTNNAVQSISILEGPEAIITFDTSLEGIVEYYNPMEIKNF